MKKILFLGGLSNYRNFVSGKSSSLSAETVQSRIINELEKKASRFTFVNCPFKLQGIDFLTDKNTVRLNDSFIDHKFIGVRESRFSIIKKIYLFKRATKNVMKSEKHDIAIGYSLFFPIFNSLLKAKKINNNVITALMIPDIPSYMRPKSKRNPMYRFARKIEELYIRKNLRHIDKIVIFSEYMASYFNIHKEKYIVIEGMCDVRKVKSDHKSPFSVTYAGGLNWSYGIKKILEMLEYMSPSIQVNICGTGEAEDEIIKFSSIHHNLKFFGKLNSVELEKLLDNSTVLINPRLPSDIFTEYSFPSKILDYMVAGRPIVCFKLKGIPSEYDPFLIYFHSTDPESMANQINNIIADQIMLDSIGYLGHKFVIENKNSQVQVEKMYQFFITAKGMY